MYNDNTKLEFETKAEAVNYLRSIGCIRSYAQKEPSLYEAKGTYVLNHGEFTRPTYRVRKTRGGNSYYIYVEYSYYRGTFNARKGGPMKYSESLTSF